MERRQNVILFWRGSHVSRGLEGEQDERDEEIAVMQRLDQRTVR
jgi:hypothetical protein